MVWGRKTRGHGSRTEKLLSKRGNAQGSVIIWGVVNRQKVVHEEAFSTINPVGQVGNFF